jgi:hypothetical protein
LKKLLTVVCVKAWSNVKNGDIEVLFLVSLPTM